MAPKSNQQFKIERKKRTISTRPLPQSQIEKFEKTIMDTDWDHIFHEKDINEKVDIFHHVLRSNLDKYFPERITKMSNLDRNWMSPELKQLHRKMQREYFKKRKSEKFKELKLKFKKLKRKTLKKFYSNFVSDLKESDPAKWYSMAKRIGAVDKMSRCDIQVQCLENKSNKQCADAIAEHFSSISNEYSPINLQELPCYLPAQPAPVIDEYEVYTRIIRLKKSKTTLPIDIPAKLRQECAPHLAAPLTTIYNQSLSQGIYPDRWKFEWVTPAPKIREPETISDLRKIACTSDYSKLFERFLKDWILEYVSCNLDIGQFGGQPGIGTEHMLVCFVDRILKLLDTHQDKSAVIASFDRQD